MCMACTARKILYESSLLLLCALISALMFYLIMNKVDVMFVLFVFGTFVLTVICVRNCCCTPGPTPVYYTEPVPVAIPVQTPRSYILIVNPHRTLTIGHLYSV
jgi:hypothetical protein